jgi:hypothetical protein
MDKNYNITLTEFIKTINYNDSLIFKKYAYEQIKDINDVFVLSMLKVPVFVISTHTSKSCKLPVYAMMLKNGIKIIMRCNFHDWVISIMSPIEISINDNLVFGHHQTYDIPPQYCEGFKNEWVFKYNTKNFKNTTVYVNDNFKLYTLLYLLNEQVINNNEKVSEIALKSLNLKYINKIVETYINRHETINDFDELFPSTYMKMTDYDFCQKNNLPIFCNSIDEICERIENYDEIKRCFIEEKICFDWGENFESNIERLK